MISGLLTVVPDSSTLLQAFIVGTGGCPGGSGKVMTKSLTNAMDPFITGEQYMGLSADGATLRCNVGAKLSQHYQKMGHDDYDPLHQ